MLLARRDRSLSDVIRVLVEYRANIGDSTPALLPSPSKDASVGGPAEMGEEVEPARVPDDAEELREILYQLIEYLKGVDN